MADNNVRYTESVNFRCLEDLKCVSTMGILDSLNLDYCGREKCEEGSSFGPYVRENYVLHVIIDGKGVFRVNDKEYKLSAGDVFLISPNEQSFYQADEEDPWTYAWIGFHGYKAKEVMMQMGFTSDNHTIVVKDVAEIEDRIVKILNSSQLTFVNELKRTSLFYDIFALILEQCDVTEKTERAYTDVLYVKIAVDTIVSSYNRRLKIAEIADKIGINRSYLTNIFKREMGVSPQTFLIDFRLEKAAEMLRTTDDPIGTIAINVGYVDSLSFSKAFKQKYNMNPSAFRANPPKLERSSEKGSLESTYPL